MAKKQKERREHDWYPTPAWCVDRLLESKPVWLNFNPVFLEPCVGDGSIVRAVDAWYRSLTGKGTRWLVNDIRKTELDCGDAEVMSFSVGDAVDWMVEMKDWWDAGRDDVLVCLTNPPFVEAMRILRTAVDRFEFVSFFLRITIFGATDSRVEWFNENPPEFRVIPDRVSFDGENTDSANCCWFDWNDNEGPGPLQILDRTPLAIRNAAKAEARRIISAREKNEGYRQSTLF